MFLDSVKINRGSKMAIDPVCGMKVDEKTAKDKSTYHGTTYFFCSNHCKDQFDESPEHYTDDDDDLATA